MLGEVHREHVPSPVVSDALVPPSHRLLGTAGPRIDVADQRRIRAEAEIDGHVSVAFIDPEVFVRVEGVVQQVLQLVGKDGLAPRQGDVSEVHEDRFPRRGVGRCEVTTRPVSAVHLVDHDLNLTVVVNIGWSKPAPIEVIFAVICGHGGVDG